MEARRFDREAWWVRVGRWSFGWDREGHTYTPLSERHGTTRSWWWRGFCLRRHGRLYTSAEVQR